MEKTVLRTGALSIYGYKLCVASVRIPLRLLLREKAEDIARIRSELKEKGRVFFCFWPAWDVNRKGGINCRASAGFIVDYTFDWEPNQCLKRMSDRHNIVNYFAFLCRSCFTTRKRKDRTLWQQLYHTCKWKFFLRILFDKNENNYF